MHGMIRHCVSSNWHYLPHHLRQLDCARVPRPRCQPHASHCPRDQNLKVSELRFWPPSRLNLRLRDFHRKTQNLAKELEIATKVESTQGEDHFKLSNSL